MLACASRSSLAANPHPFSNADATSWHRSLLALGLVCAGHSEYLFQLRWAPGRHIFGAARIHTARLDAGQGSRDDGRRAPFARVAGAATHVTCAARGPEGAKLLTSNRHHAADTVQQSPCSGHRALCSMQRTRYSGQHTTCSTRFDVPYARHEDRTVRAVQLLLVVACASPGVRPIAP